MGWGCHSHCHCRWGQRSGWGCHSGMGWRWDCCCCCCLQHWHCLQAAHLPGHWEMAALKRLFLALETAHNSWTGIPWELWPPGNGTESTNRGEPMVNAGEQYHGLRYKKGQASMCCFHEDMATLLAWLPVASHRCPQSSTLVCRWGVLLSTKTKTELAVYIM